MEPNSPFTPRTGAPSVYSVERIAEECQTLCYLDHWRFFVDAHDRREGYMPLFAAPAALYGDTPAPRLVMLDEALSGIDDETRERVLGATVAFDLHLVMTSHELWGT